MSRVPGHLTRTMFLFFSNRLGCAGSILVSVVISAILILIFYVLL